MVEPVRYTVTVAPKAIKALRHIPAKDRGRIEGAILALCINPRPPNAIALQGGSRLLRVRLGDYRLIYSVEDAVLTVLVVKVGHRREVYDR